MVTIKKRLNLTLPYEIESAIEMLAKRDQVPQATAAARLLNIALELEEDFRWDELARKRDTRKAKFVAHKKVWT